jgi:Holliday junction resolvase
MGCVVTVTPYQRGYRFERQIVADLKRHGYWVVSSRGSKGKVDVLGIKQGEILLVQAKLNGQCPPVERSALLLLARQTGGRPIVANKPPRGVTYRELTGPGPRDHQPWTPDTLGAA